MTFRTLLTRRAPRAAVVVAVVAAALSAASVASAGPVGAALAPKGVVGCDGKAHVKPAEVVLACGDGNLGVRKVTWLGWGGATTVGVGTGFVNDCEPTCVAGKFHAFRAVVIASGTQKCLGSTAYRSLTVAVVGLAPLALRTPADATYNLICH
jgi:hypothetical protein